MKVYFNRITPKRILECFKKESKFHYLGITWNIFSEGTENHRLLDEFIKYVDSLAKPEKTPRWYLNLLHLFGNDNSIIKVRNWRLHEKHNLLTNGIMITDIKIKFGQIRIYGNFPDKIYDRLKVLEDKINPTLEAY